MTVMPMMSRNWSFLSSRRLGDGLGLSTTHSNLVVLSHLTLVAGGSLTLSTVDFSEQASVVDLGWKDERHEGRNIGDDDLRLEHKYTILPKLIDSTTDTLGRME